MNSETDIPDTAGARAKAVALMPSSSSVFASLAETMKRWRKKLGPFIPISISIRGGQKAKLSYYERTRAL